MFLVHVNVIPNLQSRCTYFWDRYQRKTLCVVDISINWATSRKWQTRAVEWRQFSQSNRHSNIGTRQTEYHEALPPSSNVQSHLTSSFADDSNASWYSVCRVPMVEWRLDCENCRHLTFVGLHDTGPRVLDTWKVTQLNLARHQNE